MARTISVDVISYIFMAVVRMDWRSWFVLSQFAQVKAASRIKKSLILLYYTK